MEQGRKQDSRKPGNQRGDSPNEHRQGKAPQGFEGLNFEEQRGSLKNSDYGGAVSNTSIGRNSSDVSQEEIKRS